jgi:glutathione S-transferase
MLEQIPEPIKRERRRDVIEKGLDSPHFKVAVARIELLLTEMEQALAQHPWLATDAYTLRAARAPRNPRHDR